MRLRRNKLGVVLVAAMFVFLASCGIPAARAGMATTAPTDTREVKEVRETIERWTQSIPTMTLAEIRKTYHTENDREASYADFFTTELSGECKTQKAVRDKWGAEAEAKFAHLHYCDTLEDDQSAEIVVNHNRATVKFKSDDIRTIELIKLDGKWFVDFHTVFNHESEEDPDFDKRKIPSGEVMQQALDDIKEGKFDDADSFLADFRKKRDAAIKAIREKPPLIIGNPCAGSP